jgi:autotransporter-associated beta strand protein
LGKLTINGVGSTLYGGFRVDAGTLEFTGGTISYSQWNGSYGVGGSAVCNILGGTVNSQKHFAVGNGVSPTTEAQLNVNGGAFTCGLELLVGQNGNGHFTMTSGTASLNQLSYGDGPDASRTAIYDLNGGIINVNRTNRRGGSGTATINFNGSSVVAKSDETDFLRGTALNTTYNVKAGGAIFDTNGKNLTFLLPLVADSPTGGLTKNGLGTLTLNATNTYTGTTTVAAGILAVNGDSIANTGKLDITSGKVLIPAATNEVVATLFYNGAQQPAGVYGSTASGAPAPNQSDTYFDVTGSGTLTVNSGPAGNTYANWLTANPPATGFTTDSDNDGVSNGLENVLDSNPNAFSAGLTQVSATANSVTYQHTLNPTIASDVSYTYEWSSDLIEWKASGVANTAGTIGTIVASAPAAGVVTVTTTRSGTASSKLFTRIKAENP